MSAKDDAQAIQAQVAIDLDEIEAIAARTRTRVASLVALVPDDPVPPPPPPPPPSGDFSAFQAIRAGMADNTWYQIPNTLCPFTPTAVVDQLGLRGNLGATGILYPWCGASWDGRRMYVEGGGHADYGGNELVVFDASTLTWTRLREPAPLTDMSRGYPGPTYLPQSTHTYGGLCWTPKTGKIYNWGVYPFRRDGWGIDDGVYETDPATGVTTVCTTERFYGEQPATALAPNGDIFLHKSGHHVLFNPATRTYYSWLPTIDYGEGSAVYAPNVNRFYVLRRVNLKYAQYDGAGLTTTVENIGGVPPLQAPNPGLQWHPGSQRIVAWDGSNTIYALNPVDHTWTTHGGGAGPAFGTVAWGVWGRFAYVPEADVFIGWNNHLEGVWVFRPNFQ